MTKRLKIPIGEQEFSQAPGAGRPAGPHEAVILLKRLEAPVAEVGVMIDESVAGRYP